MFSPHTIERHFAPFYKDRIRRHRIQLFLATLIGGSCGIASLAVLIALAWPK